MSFRYLTRFHCHEEMIGALSSLNSRKIMQRIDIEKEKKKFNEKNRLHSMHFQMKQQGHSTVYVENNQPSSPIMTKKEKSPP